MVSAIKRHKKSRPIKDGFHDKCDNYPLKVSAKSTVPEVEREP